MVKVNACWFDRVHLNDVARIVAGRGSTDVTQENVFQRLALFGAGSLVDIQDDMPGRADRRKTRLGWLGVVPSSRDCDPQTVQGRGAEIPIFDHPREGKVARIV